MRLRTATGLLALLAFFTMGVTAAHAAPAKGEKLPAISVSGDDQGLVVHRGDDQSYAAFNLGKLTSGKVAIVVHMAAREGAEDMGKPLLDLLEKSKLPAKAFLPLVIVDLDDCMFGTCGLVKGAMEDRKPPLRYVIDDDGVSRKKLRLAKESFSAYLLDRTGTIVEAKTGKFSAADAKAWMEKAAAMSTAP